MSMSLESIPSPGKQAAKAPAPVPPLRLLFWETTTGCNLACIHCRRLEVSEELSRLDLTTEQSLAMIRSVPETGRPILVFSGGEPLKRPDIFELAAAATAVGLPTALATNGTLVDESVAGKIVAAGFRRVSISFDGPDAPTHDLFRRRRVQKIHRRIQGFAQSRYVDADQYHDRQAQFPETGPNLPPGDGPGGRCAAHVHAGAGGLRDVIGRERHVVGGRIRANIELGL